MKTLTQNQYIVVCIEEMKKFPKCSAHGRELSLYCSDKRCKTAICQVCLIKNHLVHGSSVVDISEDWEEKKDLLLTEVNALTKEVEDTKTKYLEKKEQVAEKNAKCIAAIKSRRRELDAMIRTVSDHTPKVAKTVDENVKTMDVFLTNLEDIRTSETTTYENVRGKLESIAEIERRFQLYTVLSNDNNFEYYEYSGNSDLQKLKLSDNENDGESEPDNDKTREEESEVNKNNRSADVSEEEESADEIKEEESEEDALKRWKVQMKQRKKMRKMPWKRKKVQMK